MCVPQEIIHEGGGEFTTRTEIQHTNLPHSPSIRVVHRLSMLSNNTSHHNSSLAKVFLPKPKREETDREKERHTNTEKEAYSVGGLIIEKVGPVGVGLHIPPTK